MINNPKVSLISSSISLFQYKIGLNETHLGMAVPPHFCQPFAALVGQRRAEYLCQTGKMLSGKEALKIGLLDQLVDRDNFDEAVEKEAQNWIGETHIRISNHQNSGLPIDARAKTKRNLRWNTVKTFEEVLNGNPEKGILDCFKEFSLVS